MTENESAIFRAEMFERARRAILGLPVDPPEKAGKAAVKPAASEPHVREIETEDHNDVD
jgi:hypothetical protein